MRSPGVTSIEIVSKSPKAMRVQREVLAPGVSIRQMSPSRVARSPVPSERKARSVGRTKRGVSGRASCRME